MNSNVEPFFKGKDCMYSHKKVFLYIIIIRSTKSQYIKDLYFQKLFFVLKEITVKNINNFFSLCRRANYTPHLEGVDLISECFIILHKNVNNFNLQQRNSFHFFYNKSLSRAFYRTYEKALRGTFVNFVDNDFYVDMEVLTYMDLTFFDYYCDRFNLSKIQRNILKFKLDGGDLDKFLIKHRMAKKVYNENFEIIKAKFIDIKLESKNV